MTQEMIDLREKLVASSWVYDVPACEVDEADIDIPEERLSVLEG